MATSAKVLAPGELRRVQARASRGRYALRNRAMVMLSFNAGLRACEIAVIQANFNMMDVRVLTSGLLAEVERLGIGFIARTPLCFGFLSGTIGHDSVFPAGDHRARWPRAQLANWVDGAADHKLKKDGKGPPSLRLVENPDILASIAGRSSILCRIAGVITAIIELTQGCLMNFGSPFGV